METPATAHLSLGLRRQVPSVKPTRIRYSVIVLAVLIDMMSYADRACISVVGSTIRSEFGLSPSQMGLVFSVFSLAYFLFQAPWGAMADRFGARGIVTLAICWWSLFTGLTAAAWNFVSLLVIRFCFGAVEAALSPSIASAYSRWVPPSERSTAFGVFLSGGRAGAAITPPVATFLLLKYGWRSVFLVFAGVGVFWAVLWWVWYRNYPQHHSRVNQAELAVIQSAETVKEANKEPVRWSAILTSRPLLSLLAVAFGVTFMWQFFITWFPTYLVEHRGFTLSEAAGYAALPFFFGMAANWIGGLATDALSHRYDPATGRTVLGFVGITLAALCMASGIFYPGRHIGALLMALTAFFADLYLGAAWSSAVAIGGRAGGVIAGLMNSSSNAAAFVSPLLMGLVLEVWHSWNAVLLLGVGTTLAGAFLWLGVNPRPSAKALTTSVAALLLMVVPALQAEELPSLAPVVRSVFPHGAQRGTSAEVVLLGDNLHNAVSLDFAGTGVSAQILSSARSMLRARIAVGSAAEVGVRDFRLTGGGGSYVGRFEIGSLAEVLEAEPNDDPRKAQRVSLPGVVNGVILSDDFDHFQFAAQSGEFLFFDVKATRISSRLDASLAILDDKGNELAWADDQYIYGDPRIEFRFERTGNYVVRVGSLQGNKNSDYRLVAGRVQHISHVLPAGLKRGRPTEILIQGSALGETERVWLGDHFAKGAILSRSEQELRVRLTAPGNVASGRYLLHLANLKQETPFPIELMVSDLEEITSSGGTVRTPVLVNGVIDKPKSSNTYEFAAAAGDQFVFEADSMRLGYPLDPHLTLLDSAGNVIASADDPGIDERSDEYQLDPNLSYTFKQAGIYRIAIRDAMYRGDSKFVYRLGIRRNEPDFLVEVREPLKTAYLGQESQMLLRVRRRSGWDTPVEIWAEGLPAGVTVPKQEVAPKDSIVKDTCGVERVVDGTIVWLPIQVSDTAPQGIYHFTVKGRGLFNGRTVERTARVHYQRYAAGYEYGPMQVERIDLTVVKPPKVVLKAPERLEAKSGQPVDLEVEVSRYLDAKNLPLRVRARSAVAGIQVEPVTADPSSKRVVLKVSASSGGMLVLVAESGSTILGECPPILVERVP